MYIWFRGIHRIDDFICLLERGTRTGDFEAKKNDLKERLRRPMKGCSACVEDENPTSRIQNTSAILIVLIVASIN